MPLFLLPLLKFIGPLFSKVTLWIFVALAVIFALWYLDPYRAKLATAQAQIAQDAANAAALAQRNDAIQKQLTGELASAQAQTVRYVTIRKAISDAPHTSSCAASPSIRAALDGLRQPAAPGSSSSN